MHGDGARMTAMTTSRQTKRTASTRTVKGKRAVLKGKQFEDNVAGLYRLLGADVVQNIEVCQKKVDILATFQLPGSTTPHRIIVECKAERTATAQNQRVMQFAGLLDLARKTGEADSAEIVTQVACGDQAKGFARARTRCLIVDYVPYYTPVDTLLLNRRLSDNRSFKFLTTLRSICS